MQKLNNLAELILLLYSALILLSFVPGVPGPPVFVILPFYVFIPGYAFIAVFFPQLNKLEKVAVSVGLSISLLIGIRSIVQVFHMAGLFSELVVLIIFSVVCLTIKLVTKIRVLR